MANYAAPLLRVLGLWWRVQWSCIAVIVTSSVPEQSSQPSQSSTTAPLDSPSKAQTAVVMVQRQVCELPGKHSTAWRGHVLLNSAALPLINAIKAQNPGGA